MLKGTVSPEKETKNISPSSESGAREPSLLVLLEYAHIANVSVERLIDDGLDLPKTLPAGPKSEGIKRKKSFQ